MVLEQWRCMAIQLLCGLWKVLSWQQKFFAFVNGEGICRLKLSFHLGCAVMAH